MEKSFRHLGREPLGWDHTVARAVSDAPAALVGQNDPEVEGGVITKKHSQAWVAQKFIEETQLHA